MEYAIEFVDDGKIIHQIQQVINKYPYLAADVSSACPNNIVNGIDKTTGNRNTST